MMSLLIKFSVVCRVERGEKERGERFVERCERVDREDDGWGGLVLFSARTHDEGARVEL